MMGTMTFVLGLMLLLGGKIFVNSNKFYIAILRKLNPNSGLVYPVWQGQTDSDTH